MAFPSVAAVNGGNDVVNQTSHTVNLPADIVAGDLLLVFFATDGWPTIAFPAGWTTLAEEESQGATVCRFGAYYRTADGTEGATITVTTSSNQMTAHTSYRITGWTLVDALIWNAPADTQPDPPPSTVPWGAQDTLWFAACGHNDGTTTVTGYPANYGDGRNDYANNSEGVGVGTATRNLNAASENPGRFTISASEEWIAATIAIKGLGARITDSLALTHRQPLKRKLRTLDSLSLTDVRTMKAYVRAVDSLSLIDVPALTLYEYYNTGDNAGNTICGATWGAQAFTPVTAHIITSVKLRLFRPEGPPETIIVSIRATDGSGYPTGPDLCSGTTNGNTLPSSPTWREITFNTSYFLSTGTKYAIVVRAPDASDITRVIWRKGPGGGGRLSVDSGSSWVDLGASFTFEEWGQPLLLALKIRFAISDALSLVDVPALKAYVLTVDSLSLSDIVFLPAAAVICKLVSDDLSLAEILELKALLATTDSLGLTDIPLLRLFKAISDSLALAEAPSLKAQLALLDSLALAEAAGVKGAITVADALALAEAASIRTFLTVTESLSLSDVAALKLFKAVADALALSDIPGLRAKLTVSDALALIEATVLRARLLLADSLSLAESLAILNRVRLADALSVADMLALKARLAQADSLSLLGLPAIRVSLSVTETLALAEAIARQFNISVEDSLALVDFIQVLRGILVSDSLKVSDVVPSVWLKFRYAQYLALPKALPKRPVFRV